jgi:hypothetical protein
LQAFLFVYFEKNTSNAWVSTLIILRHVKNTHTKCTLVYQNFSRKCAKSFLKEKIRKLFTYTSVAAERALGIPFLGKGRVSWSILLRDWYNKLRF